MKIDVLSDNSKVLLTSDTGKMMQISFSEFWEICRFGNELDVTEEVKEYLSQTPSFNGVASEDIINNSELFEKIVDKVIDYRVGQENGDQIYNVICEYVQGVKPHSLESGYAAWKEFSLSKEECDNFVDLMVGNIRGIGIDEGSGYAGLKSFELYGEQFNLYCEISKEQEDGDIHFAVYYALEFDEGDTLWSDWAYTETFDIDELKKVIFDIANADYTKDVQMNIDIGDLNISEDIRDILKNNRLTTLANIVNIGRDGLKLVPGLDELGYSEVALALGQLGIELPEGYEKTADIVKSIDRDKIIPGSKVVIDIVDKELGETVWVNPGIAEDEKTGSTDKCVCVDVVYEYNPIDAVEVFKELDFWAESRFNALTLANAISEEYGIPVKNLIPNEVSLENVIADAQDRAENSNGKDSGKNSVCLDI